MFDDRPLWVAVAVVWFLGFLLAILVVTRLEALWAICLVTLALTTGLLAILAFMRSLTPDRQDANREVLIVFLLIGVLVFVTAICLIILQFGGVLL